MSKIINSKIKNIKSAIKDLENNRKVLHRVGGLTSQGPEAEIEFQTKRLELFKWCLEAEQEEIEQELEDLEGQLEEDELACKYGIVKGLPGDTIEKLIKIEDLELALGIHPALGGE
ncbi:hypothetical protein [Natroniella sp. ANB-PHB2]|uniref:hypothetical protein n=1 Tax=Natroniella sp. ANB-PHB2 TaxID=3384444 RepID=UPI0038D516F9